MEHNDVIEIDLLKLIRALLKKAWLIILVAVIAAAAMFVRSKMNYTPSYYAFSILYVQGSENDTSYSSSDAAMRIKTLNAFRKTQTMIDEVNQMTGLTLDRDTLSDLVVIGAVSGSELLTVTATCDNPEQAVLLASTVTEILPKYAQLIHGVDSVVVFEEATEAIENVRSSNSVKKAVVAGILGACLVCVGIVAKEFYFDWKAHSAKNA